MIKIVFVCLGNICRSPSAEGIFRKKVQEKGLEHLFYIDSAGTSAHHVGEAPDARSQAEAERFGYDLSMIRSRQLVAQDGEEFDYIIAMDESNAETIKSIISIEYHYKVKLFLKDFEPYKGLSCLSQCSHGYDVPDPYYGGAKGFTRVVELIETASNELFEYLTVK